MLTSRIDTEPQRLDYLDSVRGIAAMMVVIYHFIGIGRIIQSFMLQVWFLMEQMPFRSFLS